jgi:putative acetyltransferase
MGEGDSAKDGGATAAPVAGRVRRERPGDAPAVRRVVAAAFGRPEEADLVEALRAGGRVTLALVAVLGGDVVGHVVFSPVRVEEPGGGWAAVALGPLAVAPAYQGRGIGTVLVRRGLAACRRAGHGVVFVVGHPAYYPRFGFRPAAPSGIGCELPVSEAAFMLIELRPGALDGRRGVVRYAPEFRADA